MRLNYSITVSIDNTDIQYGSGSSLEEAIENLQDGFERAAELSLKLKSQTHESLNKIKAGKL